MDTGDHLTALLSEGRLFARALDRADWDTAVPSCPDWSVRDLVVHLGGVHRWVTAFVTTGRTERTSREERAAFGEHPADAHLAEWFVQGHETLVDALATADPALRCWTVLPGLPPRASWARRQAHETLVHRLDAELAAGVTPTRVDPELAGDGIAELLVDWVPIVGKRRLVTDPARTVVVRASDTGGVWAVALTPDGPVLGSPADADLTLAGTAEDLHRMLWNRDGGTADGVSVTGDDDVLALWRSGVRV